MIVIGAGRVGGALDARARERGERCHLVSRDAGWEALDQVAGTPVILAVRNDDLPDVLSRIPEYRRDDLVFVQNGALRTFLADNGLGNATRGLLFFAVPARGAPLEEGGTSVFCGDQAPAVVQWMMRLGLAARTVDWGRFSAFELEKLIWNTAFGLLCEVHDAPVGAVVSAHRDELAALTAELSGVGRAAMGVDLPLDWLVDRLCAYSETIPAYQGAVKEWPWRNGWFVDTARVYGQQTPVHHALLRQAGKGDLL